MMIEVCGVYSKKNAKLFTEYKFNEVTVKYLNTYQEIPVMPEKLQKAIQPELSRDINEQMDDDSSLKSF